jgi:hypothetical protein
MTASLGSLPFDIAICAGLFLLGVLVVWSLVGREDVLAHLSLGLGVGGGLLSFALFLVSWAGLPLNSSSLISLYVGLVVIFLAFALGRSRAGPGAPISVGVGPSARPAWLPGAIWLMIALVAAAAFVVSLGLSYYAWDDIATWSVGGYGIALEESIFAAGHWGNAGLLYPLNTQLQIAMFRILDGDALPGSKILFPAFYLSLLFGCYRFLTRQGISRTAASAGILVLASVPVIANHATMGYNNLQFSLYLVLGILWILEGMNTRSTRPQVLGGLLLGLSVWTRPEGLAMAVAAVVGIWATDRVTGRRAMCMAALIVPPAMLSVPWIVFRALYPVGTVEAYRDVPLALEGLLGGDIRWGAVWAVIRYLAGQILRYRDWGLTLSVVGVLLLWKLRPRQLRDDAAKAGLLLTSVSLSAVVLFAHYMVAYAGKGEGFVYDWLALEFTRVFMPVGIALLLLAMLTTFAPHGVATLRGRGVTAGDDVAFRPGEIPPGSEHRREGAASGLRSPTN